MRWFYLAIVVVFVAALIVFVFQNTASVDVSFLALGATLPLAVLVSSFMYWARLAAEASTRFYGDQSRAHA